MLTKVSIFSKTERGFYALVIIISVILTGWVGSRATLPNIPDWYEGLTKPWFNPPNWVFGPVWSILYLLLMYSAWRIVIRLRTRRELFLPALVFAAQLFFNALWSITFFGMRDPFHALGVVGLLEASVIAMILVFARYDRKAAAIQLPYALWVAFASLLNLAVVFLNPIA